VEGCGSDPRSKLNSGDSLALNVSCVLFAGTGFCEAGRFTIGGVPIPAGFSGVEALFDKLPNMGEVS